MTNLSEFLLNDTIETTKKIELTGRLKGHPFEIRSLSQKELDNYKKTSRRIVGTQSEIDDNMLNMLIIKNHVVDPNFKSAEMIEQAQVNTPEELINKVLKLGEIQALALAIFEMSGLNVTFEEVVEEAKN